MHQRHLPRNQIHNQGEVFGRLSLGYAEPVPEICTGR